MKLKIISPEAVNFEGEVQSVTLPGAMGAFTVLKNHASLISTLVAGKLVYTPEAGTAEESLEIEGGIVDVDNNVISVCLY
ncbi:MAG: F0F1 ATP synthase subunit epsilon [Muribaculaceae bacterium]|nr:F0F1 ATP synthase subunit epsilon [Muribaculaceae bacterium]MDE7458194.1 F0F1 ATP synthase subunit epsilon [Muribaculaceae bacterium]